MLGASPKRPALPQSVTNQKLLNMVLDLALMAGDLRGALIAMGARQNPEANRLIDESLARVDSLIKTAKEIAESDG